MSHASEPAFLVLHTLRLKGFASAEAVAGITGQPLADVDAALAQAKDDAWVMYREGRVSGWALTPAGRERHGELLGAERSAAGYREAVQRGYTRFLDVNADLLAVCTDWQMRSGPDDQPVLNDHSDPD